MATPLIRSIQLPQKKNGSLCPINFFSLPLLLSVCFHHVLVSVLISLSHRSLPASIYPLFTNPLHLANDKNSSENTSHENCDCLPCGCAKVWTYALLKKKIKHRHAQIKQVIKTIRKRHWRTKNGCDLTFPAYFLTQPPCSLIQLSTCSRM